VTPEHGDSIPEDALVLRLVSAIILFLVLEEMCFNEAAVMVSAVQSRPRKGFTGHIYIHGFFCIAALRIELILSLAPSSWGIAFIRRL
jgi:hypothetical protein